MEKKIFLRFFIYFFAIEVQAQKGVCGNDFFFKDSTSIVNSGVVDEVVANYLASNSSFSRSEVIISVVVHIVWNKPEENLLDALILSQIDELNKDYNAENKDIENVPDAFKLSVGNIGIRFCLATLDVQGNPTVGIVRTYTNKTEIGLSDDVFFTSNGGSSAWDTNKYLNIWVANTGVSISGLGTYPNQTPPEKTGIVVHPKYFGINGHPKYGLGRVASHEIGHFFGLKHLWGDDLDCNTDDEVIDTPIQKMAYTGCPNFPQANCSPSEMYMNFMDYVDDQCMYMFTLGQKNRILAVLDTYRSGLSSLNTGCVSKQSNYDNQLVIFPNPSTGILYCSYSTPYNNIVKYDIFNITAQLIEHREKLINTGFSLDLSFLPAGIYLLKIGGIIHKIIKI